MNHPGHPLSNGIGKDGDTARSRATSRVTDSFNSVSTVTAPRFSQDVSAPIPREEMDALKGLSALSIAGRPKFTEQQEALERAAMTNEERAAALSDIFGKHCSTGIESPQSRRARRDLDSDSIEFLVGRANESRA